jgi:hypothetical protein
MKTQKLNNKNRRQPAKKRKKAGYSGSCCRNREKIRRNPQNFLCKNICMYDFFYTFAASE